MAYNLYPRLKPGATISVDPTNGAYVRISTYHTSPHPPVETGLFIFVDPYGSQFPVSFVNPRLKPGATIPAEPLALNVRHPPLKWGATILVDPTDLDATAYNLYPRLKPGATIPAEPLALNVRHPPG